MAPSREPAGDLGREIEIWSLERSWTAQMLEFASDGESILYSSGAMDGSDGEFAPDLWRYHPSTDEPELLWRNPRRDRSLVKIGGEFGTWAFVDMPLSGEIAWDFWLIPEAGADPILLDSHPGPGTLPDFVPSFHVHQDQVAWTAFDLGPNGEALSRLLYARAPDWTPVVVAERDARLAELWFPSLRDTQLAYCEVIYSADRTTDERHVYLVDAAHLDIPPRRLDSSGRATMPILLINRGVVWKEADPGFSMFNWGTMYHYDEETARGHSPADAAAGVRELPVRRLALHRRLGRGHQGVRRLRPGPGHHPAHRSLARRDEHQHPSAAQQLGAARVAGGGDPRRRPGTGAVRVPAGGRDRPRPRPSAAIRGASCA